MEVSGLLGILLLSAIFFYILYLIILTAVKNGIRESREAMSNEFKKAMKETLAERHWEKENK